LDAGAVWLTVTDRADGHQAVKTLEIYDVLNLVDLRRQINEL